MYYLNGAKSSTSNINVSHAKTVSKPQDYCSSTSPNDQMLGLRRAENMATEDVHKTS